MSEKGLKAMTVAIIGTGMAGLACAGVMASAGHRVVLFDKSRGYGGRVASRRRDGFAFDHGLPAFDPVARETVEALAGLTDWNGRGTVAAPRMNALPRMIGEEFESRMGAAIQRIDPADLTLTDDTGSAHGGFERVVVAVPAPQAVALLDGHDGFEAAARATYAPGWTLMIGGVGEGVDSAPGAGPLARIIRDDAKPGHPAATPCWVAHARDDWTAANLEREKDDVAQELARAFTTATGIDTREAGYIAAHRWRYCHPRAVAEAPFLRSAGGRIGACGDWCSADRTGGDARAAWRSGEALGRAMIG